MIVDQISRSKKAPLTPPIVENMILQPTSWIFTKLFFHNNNLNKPYSFSTQNLGFFVDSGYYTIGDECKIDVVLTYDSANKTLKEQKSIILEPY
jgi:hypothetical protein